MEKELNRQLVHLSGLLFAFLAQFIGRLYVGFYLIMVAFTLLAYSHYIRREMSLFARLEMKIRDIAVGLERNEVSRPFIGAFWFFFASGLVFLLFPLDVASASVTMLAVGDGLSTLVGMRFGRHRIVGNKTLEGSTVMFVSCFSALLFLPLVPVFLGSLASVLAELAPETRVLHKWKRKGLLDDNLLIPFSSALVISLALFLSALA